MRFNNFIDYGECIELNRPIAQSAIHELVGATLIDQFIDCIAAV